MTAWAVIDTTQTPTWIGVDVSQINTWTGVDTGSTFIYLGAVATFGGGAFAELAFAGELDTIAGPPT
jgi:hypothetical protein